MILSKSVIVNLNAKWPTTSLIAEMSEFFATRNAELYWTFVEGTTKFEFNQKTYNSFDSYKTALSVAENLLTSKQVSLLKFYLSLRYFSPMVQMHQEIADEKLSSSGHCEVFVEVENFITCELMAFKAFIRAINSSHPLVLKNDHIYPTNLKDGIHVILYGQLGTKSFNFWHDVLKQMSNDEKIIYVHRHFLKTAASTKCSLSGFGVELAIKSTEYKAKDDSKILEQSDKKNEMKKDDVIEGFNFSKLREIHPDSEKDLTEFQQFLIDGLNDMAPLKVWQLQDLSLQLAQVVLNAKENAMHVLVDLCQNFPSKTRELIKVTVKDDLRKEIKENQKYLEQALNLYPGDSAFYINGLNVGTDIIDIFNILDVVDTEMKLLDGLHQVSLQFNTTFQKLSALLHVDFKEADLSYGLDIRHPSIWYINNLESDEQYRSWPGSVQDLLRPSFPGMLRHIKKNMFHLVIFCDPVDKKSLEILKMIENFYFHSAPVRIGLMLVSLQEDEAKRNLSNSIIQMFAAIHKSRSPIDALQFLTNFDEKLGEEENLTFDAAVEYFKTKYSNEWSEVQSADHALYDLQESEDYFWRTGLMKLPQVLLNGVPFTEDEVNNEFDENVVRKLLKQTNDFQKAVFNVAGPSGLTNDIIKHLVLQKNIMPRINSQIFSENNVYIDLTQSNNNVAVASDFSYLFKNGLFRVDMLYELIYRPLTIWIVADLRFPEGRSLFNSALKHLKHTNKLRLGLIHNIDSWDSAEDVELVLAVQLAISTLKLNVAKNFINKILKEENVEMLKNREKSLSNFAVGNMEMDLFVENLNSVIPTVHSHRQFCHQVLKFGPSASGVIANGKVFGPLSKTFSFVEQDFDLLEKFSYSSFGEKISNHLKNLNIDELKSSELAMRLETLFGLNGMKEGRKQVQLPKQSASVLKMAANEEGPSFNLIAIIDPTSRIAQKLSQIIMVLCQFINCQTQIFFNSKEKLSELPLKSYYKFVLDRELYFDDDGELLSNSAIFTNLPEKSLLTLNMDTPESWFVESIYSPHDLDNIFMHEVVENNVEAVFELEKLLLEGHCYDVVSGNPPRGLQFVLGTNSTPALVDTIVMANLGYFQLKASPGLWYLRLREGKSKDLYDIVKQNPEEAKDIMVVMDSFKSKIIRVKVSKKPGKEFEDLLSGDDDDDGSEDYFGLWGSISKGSSATPKTSDEEDKTINIFSLASGHLYERFLRIMVLSVMKNTKSKVKFWFLKNYLSPSFKDFIPKMAEEYSFEYELVQYKWPRWLHQQTEKQRIIWGYKILFLDVLFPLNINKIIFVDADQVIIFNLYSLTDALVKNLTFAFAPSTFCIFLTTNMFLRFWKTGYWSSHLGHRKYHISALYVVDLKRFRRIAAGDRLRGQYQGLSQDPNSLSNLDQDLPNNMIHQVAIKSLPQEWLWCETWCSNEEKSKAKTIDLCNNPKTKEPKLEAAMRIVDEWKSYDDEIKRLWDSVYSQNETDSEQKHEGHVEL
ncbi:hypothetical protein HELRODRAFT_115758 [Helobdella robusta]|uniref:Glucosyltransferase 24 catalytic domain-containing protein n=1 Tax=Helobdella robusta TaxID=6412 RepID=T1EGA2_HELRO|nr:hypothetical protein HELRODRAFT_115758 [Helobdella robusta]ESN93236.1 hypothetical protein HELRODRAFT_115758 [Helobdella robusta]